MVSKMAAGLEQFELMRAAALSLQSAPTYVLLFTDQERCRLDADLFAVAVSQENHIKVYKKESFCSYCILEGHKGTITGLVFSVIDSNHIWSSSLDATIRCWDTTPGMQVSIYELKGDILERFSALNISFDGKFMCAGTETTDNDDDEDVDGNGDVFLYVWNIEDFSNVRLHVKYGDLHSDDITQVMFHPLSKTMIATGSTDGLVCLSDISKSENEMLLQTFNTESSVHRIGFFGQSYEYLFATTYIETVHFWDCTSGDQLGVLPNIRNEDQGVSQIDYIIDGFYHESSQRLFLVAGTFSGRLEILHANLGGVELFQSLKACHSSTIRCVLFTSKTGRLLAGGEDGMVSMWAPVREAKSKKIHKKSTAKMPREKKRKMQPYKSERDHIS